MTPVWRTHSSVSLCCCKHDFCVCAFRSSVWNHAAESLHLCQCLYLLWVFDQCLHPLTQPPPPPPLPARGWVEPVTGDDIGCWRCTVARCFDAFDRFFWEMVLLLSNLSYLSVSPSVTLSILIWSSQLLRFGPWVCSNVSYRAICSTVSLIFSQLLAVWEENLRECSLRRPGSAALKFACCLALKLMHPCCLTSAPSVLYSHIHIYIS